MLTRHSIHPGGGWASIDLRVGVYKRLRLAVLLGKTANCNRLRRLLNFSNRNRLCLARWLPVIFITASWRLLCL
jgi:hypothetical protein